jgi:predicted RNA-binding Zn ribbon-like protein
MEPGNLADLRIVGGHPALDLVNTVAPRAAGGVREEFLSSPEALLEWARLAGVISAAQAARLGETWSSGAAAAALADVLALRDLAERVLAGQDLDVLTRRWSEAIARSALVRTGDRLADALVDLVRHADLARLRTCPLDEGGCGWLFLDRSRNLTRKWCSMQDCGTHAKSRRLTERRRASR